MGDGVLRRRRIVGVDETARTPEGTICRGKDAASLNLLGGMVGSRLDPVGGAVSDAMGDV